MTKPKFINSIRELGKAYRDKRGRRPQAPVPVEYCPECMSLKRKPNKECVNHDSYWVDIEVTKLYRDIKNSGLKNATDTLAEQMVRTIANKHIKVQDTHEGKSHQRHWYLQAQKMLKKLVKEYKRVCKERYK